MSQGFLLDTNVLSEPMREQPAAAVLNWFCENPLASMQTSTITQAEILTGIALLPAGKRRMALALAAEQMFEEDFAGLIVVTRNTKDFDNVDGLLLVNPWQDAASR